MFAMIAQLYIYPQVRHDFDYDVEDAEAAIELGNPRQCTDVENVLHRRDTAYLCS